MTIKKNETPTKAICNKGCSGNSSILSRLNLGVADRAVARNPLRHIASTVVRNAERQTYCERNIY
jgi:hypothetical protein